MPNANKRLRLCQERVCLKKYNHQPQLASAFILPKSQKELCILHHAAFESYLQQLFPYYFNSLHSNWSWCVWTSVYFGKFSPPSPWDTRAIASVWSHVNAWRLYLFYSFSSSPMFISPRWYPASPTRTPWVAVNGTIRQRQFDGPPWGSIPGLSSNNLSYGTAYRHKNLKGSHHELWRNVISQGKWPLLSFISVIPARLTAFSHNVIAFFLCPE